ncbi:MAG: HD domain-containing protein [Candidatus Sumerlaeia bacterium]|nr:HD domain-containing protein [Candidatus Sumerlaeia bacterium]
MTDHAAPNGAASTPPHVRISELRPGMTIQSAYLVASVEQRTKKNGEPFFMLQLADVSGTIPAVMWDNHDSLVAGTVGVEDFAVVTADVAEFKDAPQLTLRRIGTVDEALIDTRNFLAESPRPRAEMEAELDALLARIRHPDVRRLMAKMLGHPKLREAYCTAPAAARLHQAYRGGLLEHTLIVVNHALNAAPQYEPVNRDVLIAGALLHDVGKVREYSWRRTILYTDEGRLLGHVVMGAMMAEAAIRELQREPEGFDDSLRRHILHLILSHHGKLEWGAPSTPKTREALLLHYADQMDAFMVIATDDMKRAAVRGDEWTSYNRFFESYLFAGTPAPLEEAERERFLVPPPGPLAPASGPADDTGPTTKAAAGNP